MNQTRISFLDGNIFLTSVVQTDRMDASSAYYMPFYFVIKTDFGIVIA